MPKQRFLLALPLLAAACAPSPLYVGRQAGPMGVIPRDARGEPLWEAIAPAPPGTPRALPVPVLPPPGHAPLPQPAPQ